MPTKKLVKRYFNAWQHPADMDELKECLHPDFKLDNGTVKFQSRKEFLEFLTTHHSEWKEVKILSEIYTANRAAILYTGYMPDRGTNMRVAEYIEVENGVITEVNAVLSRP
jgi:hypothetical protein